jgi:hypothetical protein
VLQHQARPVLYVMKADGEPFACLTPFMSEASRFIRLTGDMPLEPEMPLRRKTFVHDRRTHQDHL